MNGLSVHRVESRQISEVTALVFSCSRVVAFDHTAESDTFFVCVVFDAVMSKPGPTAPLFPPGCNSSRSRRSCGMRSRLNRSAACGDPVSRFRKPGRSAGKCGNGLAACAQLRRAASVGDFTIICLTRIRKLLGIPGMRGFRKICHRRKLTPDTL